MGQEPVPVPEDPWAAALAAVSTWEQFVDCLVKLRESKGVSYRDIQRTSRRTPHGISRQAAQNLLSGKTRAEPDSIIGFLTGCGVPADRHGPWMRKYHELHQPTANGSDRTSGRPAGEPGARGNFPLPSRNFLPRPELEAAVWEALLRPVAAGSARTVAIIGMTGVGKSTLARAVGSGSLVTEHFPDGALWIDLGPDGGASTTAGQSQILEHCGRSGVVRDRSTGLQAVHRALADRRLLIVLDDVWSTDQVKALLPPPGSGSALLITSRDERALFFDTDRIRVQPLPPGPDADLVLTCAGPLTDSPPAGHLARVTHACDGLPLALAIAGSLVGEAVGHWGYSPEDAWADVAARLERQGLTSLEARFQDYPYPSLWAALEASVTSLSAYERDRFRALAAVNDHGWIPVAAVHRLWRREVRDVHECRDLLSTFARRALLDYERTTERVRLHSLVQDYLVRVCDEPTRRAWHLRIAMAYLDDWGGVAEGLPALAVSPTDTDQGTAYGLSRVIHHLVSADALGLAAEVLGTESTADGRQNVWLTVRERAGQFAEYLEDLARVAESAAARTDADLAAGRPTDWLVVELTCAALHASLVGQAANLPGPLLAALVRRGGWTVDRALGYARRMPGPEQRATALTCLLPEAPERERLALAQEALEYVRIVSEPGPAVALLVALAPWLPGKLDHEIPWILTRTAPAQRFELRLSCTAFLAAHLSPDFVTDQINCAAETGLALDTENAQFVTLVAPYAPPESHHALLSTARAVTYPGPRLAALAAVHDVLPADQRRQVLDDMVETALSRSGMLAAGPGLVLARLPDDRRETVARDLLAATRVLDDLGARLSCLRDLGDTLPDEVTAEINAVLRSWREFDWRSAALLLAYLDEQQRQRVVDGYRNERPGVRPPGHEQALVALAPYVSADVAAEAVDEINRDTDLGDRCHRLIRIADHLPGPLRDRSYARLLQDLVDRRDPYETARVLRQLAPVLPDELVDTALDALVDGGYSKDVGEVLGLLSPRLTAEQLRRAFALVRPAEDATAFTRGMSRLAVLLPDVADATVTRLVDLAIGGGTFAVEETLPELVARLPLDDLPDRLRKLDRTGPSWQSQIVVKLADRLRPGDVPAVLAFARGIRDAQHRAYALAALARTAPVADGPALYREALHDAAVPTYSDYYDTDYGWRSEKTVADLRCLAQLARDAPEAVLPDVVDLAIATPERAELIAVTWGRLDARQRATWRRAVEGFDRRLDLSIALLPHLAEPERAALAGEMLDDLRQGPPEQDFAGSAGWKRHLMALLPVLPPHLSAEARTIAARVLSPGELLVSLPGLDEEERTELGRAALTKIIEDRWFSSNNRAWAIHNLAPHLSPAVLPQALRMVTELNDGYDRRQAFVGLAAHLPVELVPAARDIALGLSAAHDRVATLVALSPVMSDVDLRSVLRSLLAEGSPDTRAKALEGLAPYLPPDQIPDALAALEQTQGSRHHPMAAARFVDMFADPASRNHQPRWNDRWRTLLNTAAVDRRSYFYFLGRAAGAIRSSLDDAGALRLIKAMEDVRRWVP